MKDIEIQNTESGPTVRCLASEKVSVRRADCFPQFSGQVHWRRCLRCFWQDGQSLNFSLGFDSRRFRSNSIEDVFMVSV